jgi:hypothetical protein
MKTSRWEQQAARDVMQKEEHKRKLRRRGRRSFGKTERNEKAWFLVDPYKSENIKERRSNLNHINLSQWFVAFSSK